MRVRLDTRTLTIAGVCAAAVLLGLLIALFTMPRIGDLYETEAVQAAEETGETAHPQDISADAEAPADIDVKASSPQEMTGRVAFLSAARGQLGSAGEIIGSDGPVYFTQWYVGGAYAAGWDEDTPWCGAFVSWAAAQAAGYIDGFTPFAVMETGMALFTDGTNGAWMDADERPLPGDIIFFDWDEPGGEDYGAPDHVGIVTRTDDAAVYTIEGNCDGLVRACSYEAGDPRIMGYGVLRWK